MKKQTRQVFGQYETRLGQLNDTDNVAKTFSVTPSVQQKLETKMQESSEFLSKVNIIGVTEQEGEKLGLGVSGPIAGRTNTKDKERKTRDLSTLDGTKYRCEQTNFDTHLNYAKLDAWAKFPDFQSRVANAILTRQALDRIVIGFNGVKVMADTDLDANPLLQDVNKGWLQHLRDLAPERVLGLVAAGMPGKVVIGDVADADYANLDAAVTDAVNLLDPWYQEDTNLVAI
ncbi:P2 family phage major capsid protein, partial [Janthinobacterium sp. HH104]